MRRLRYRWRRSRGRGPRPRRNEHYIDATMHRAGHVARRFSQPAEQGGIEPDIRKTGAQYQSSRPVARMAAKSPSTSASASEKAKQPEFLIAFLLRNLVQIFQTQCRAWRLHSRNCRPTIDRLKITSIRASPGAMGISAFRNLPKPVQLLKWGRVAAGVQRSRDWSLNRHYHPKPSVRKSPTGASARLSLGRSMERRNERNDQSHR